LTDKSGKHAVYCRSCIDQAVNHVAQAAKREQDNRSLIESTREAERNLQAEIAERERAEEEARRLEKERQEAAAREKAEYLERISKDWVEVKSEENQKARDRKEMMQDKIDGESDARDYEEDADLEVEKAKRKERGKKREKKKREKKVSEEDESEGGGVEDLRKKKKKRSKYQPAEERARPKRNEKAEQEQEEAPVTQQELANDAIAAIRAKRVREGVRHRVRREAMFAELFVFVV